MFILWVGIFENMDIDFFMAYYARKHMFVQISVKRVKKGYLQSLLARFHKVLQNFQLYIFSSNKIYLLTN